MPALPRAWTASWSNRSTASASAPRSPAAPPRWRRKDLSFSLGRCRGTLNAGAASQPAQRDLLDLMAFALLEDQIGAGPGRQDIFAQVDQVDAVPDRSRGGDRLRVGQLRVAVKVRLRVGEGGAAQGEKAADVPRQRHAFIGIEIHREIEEVGDEGHGLAVLGQAPGLQHVETLDNEDLGPVDLDLLVRNDVVDQVRVDRRTYRVPAGFDFG